MIFLTCINLRRKLESVKSMSNIFSALMWKTRFTYSLPWDTFSHSSTTRNEYWRKQNASTQPWNETRATYTHISPSSRLSDLLLLESWSSFAFRSREREERLDTRSDPERFNDRFGLRWWDGVLRVSSCWRLNTNINNHTWALL